MRGFALIVAAFLMAGMKATGQAQALQLDTVLKSVASQYPPYLMALIERDIAAGRLRQAQGAFDIGFLARGSFNPSGYYDGNSADFVFDQPLPFWGGNVFAGYRISSGSLADYDKNRTQADGELRAGIRLNLLRDGAIDRRRAEVWKARLDQEIADPFIQRQHLDIVRAASRAYYNWVAMGLRLSATEELLRIAKNREDAVKEMVAKGLSAPIIQVDNERLIISRQIAAVQARRRFEAAAIELSLFVRDASHEPRIITRADLPPHFSALPVISGQRMTTDLTGALALRPELRRIGLLREKISIDHRVAENALLPHLDLAAEVAQNNGAGPYKDKRDTEARVSLEFRVPLQRNEAKGRLQVVEAEIQRLENDAQFARQRIVAEVRDAWSAVEAATEQLTLARRHVALAAQLEEAEATRFSQGATDLLALQIREQATFEAKLSQIDAEAEGFRAHADYEAATGYRLKRPDLSPGMSQKLSH